MPQHGYHALIDFHLPFFSSQSDLTEMSGVSWRTLHCDEDYYECGVWTLSSSPSPASLHVNLLCPAGRTVGPPPHSLENNCCLMTAAVLLLQKDAQTFFVRNFSKRYLAKGICFHFYRHRQRLPATAAVLSIICKRKCLPSNDHHGQQTIQPEICHLSLVWIRNFIEHAIKQKTTSGEYRRFHSICRTSWERENIFLLHLQVLHQFPVINYCWFPTTAFDFHRLITRAWTLHFRHLN